MTYYCPQCKARFEENHGVCPRDGSQLFLLKPSKSKVDPLLGATLDSRFLVDERIGSGGMGTVYKATQTSVGRPVAIKVLREDLAENETALTRFFHEAKIVSGLTHPNTVRLVEFGQDRDRDLLYLAMELVEGISLGDLLRQGSLRPELALQIAFEICSALTEPHSLGVVHRDLKADNVFLRPGSDSAVQLKVLDFGIARNLSSDTRITKTGIICGTPAYMSPEQAQNLPIDPRSDLYSLGVLLFEMVSGHRPFVAEQSLQILLCHVHRPPPRLSDSLAGVVPEPLSDLVADLLAKSPDDRPESAMAVRQRIDQIRRDLAMEPVHLDTSLDDPFSPWILPRPQRSTITSDPTPLSLDDALPAEGQRDFAHTLDQFLALPADSVPTMRRQALPSDPAFEPTPPAPLSTKAPSPDSSPEPEPPPNQNTADNANTDDIDWPPTRTVPVWLIPALLGVIAIVIIAVFVPR